MATCAMQRHVPDSAAWHLAHGTCCHAAGQRFHTACRIHLQQGAVQIWAAQALTRPHQAGGRGQQDDLQSKGSHVRPPALLLQRARERQGHQHGQRHAGPAWQGAQVRDAVAALLMRGPASFSAAPCASRASPYVPGCHLGPLTTAEGGLHGVCMLVLSRCWWRQVRVLRNRIHDGSGGCGRRPAAATPWAAHAAVCPGWWGSSTLRCGRQTHGRPLTAYARGAKEGLLRVGGLQGAESSCEAMLGPWAVGGAAEGACLDRPALSAPPQGPRTATFAWAQGTSLRHC